MTVNEPRNPKYTPRPEAIDVDYTPRPNVDSPTTPTKTTSGKGKFFEGVGSALKDTGKGLAKGANAVSSGVSKTYRGIGRASAAHQARVLRKEDYRARRLSYKIQRQQAKEFLPQATPRPSPLSDSRLPKLNPLSDKIASTKKFRGLSDRGVNRTGATKKYLGLSDRGLPKFRGLTKSKGKKKGGFFA